MTAAELLEAARDVSVLVVGDICLDRWCTYDPRFAEPSRETGLNRVAVVGTEVTPGAGGTVANNLRALGVQKVAVLGVTGEDGFGWELKQALSMRGISADLMVASPHVSTFTYTKLLNGETGEEDLGRIDYITPRPLPAEVEERVYGNLQLFARAFDVVIVSDQAETDHGGVVTERIRRALSDIALEDPARVIWVDSRMRAELFRNVILKPNLREAEEASARLLGRVDLAGLREHTRAPLLIVTEGAGGARVFRDGEELRVETRAVGKPVDICGAGDSFSAGAAVALAVTGSPVSAARFGNLVASITIMKLGTGTASPEEVLAADREWASA